MKADDQPAADPAEAAVQDCWKRAREAFGTSFIFEERSRKLSRLLRTLSFMGLFVPVLIGGLVTGFGLGFDALPFAIAVGAVIAVGQSLFSLWSIVAAWVESHAYSVESMVENRNLYAKFKELAQNPPGDWPSLQLRYELLKASDQARRGQDLRKGITGEEKRKGMRAGLRELGQTCAACKKQPFDMESTDCHVCGKF